MFLNNLHQIEGSFGGTFFFDFVDSIRGIETLKYLGLSKKHVEKIIFVSKRYRKAVKSTLKIAFLSTFALDFFTMLFIATVAVFLGMGLLHGSIALQTGLTILILAPEYFLSIREVGADYHATLDGKEAGKKFQEILQMNPSGPLLLENFNLKVSQGERIAILGPSGAGKSTLLQLILGAHEPTYGEVLLNGNQAHSMASSISKVISVLNQKAYLFHTSVFNNIRLGNEDATEKEVFEAAERVGLHEMIKGLPDGYSTNMQETGQRFSGGERQRIALARVLLQKTSVVILDEPTVGLDPITENKLLATIFDALQGKTIFGVTHHLTGMELMNQIIFMDQGKITMSGSHQQLLEKQERYRRLYKLDQPLSELKS